MKWVFAILVALNLIVFGSMVAQRMLLKENTPVAVVSPAPPAPVLPQTPVPAVPQADLPAPAQPAENQAENENPAEVQAAAEKPAAPAAQSVKEKPKDPPKPKPKDPPKEKSREPAQAAQTAAAPPRPKNCGGGSVKLPENVYHRIKGLLAEWPNAASRSVEQNAQAGQKSTVRTYWVTVAQTGDDPSINLMAKGFRPTRENGLIVLGKFSSRQEAESLRRRAAAAGFSASVGERLRPGAQEEPLSVGVYTVVFLKISDADAPRLQKILAPYAKLQRNPCK